MVVKVLYLVVTEVKTFICCRVEVLSAPPPHLAWRPAAPLSAQATLGAAAVGPVRYERDGAVSERD